MERAAKEALELEQTYVGAVEPVVQRLWYLRSKVTGLLEPRAFCSRADARYINKRLYEGKFSVVGPYVLSR